MSAYRVQVEWKSQGKEKQGMVFFEAESPEKAKAEVKEAVDAAIYGDHHDLVIHEPHLCQPVHLVMWDKSEIASLNSPMLTKLEPSARPITPKVQAASSGGSPERIPASLERQLRGGRR